MIDASKDMSLKVVARGRAVPLIPSSSMLLLYECEKLSSIFLKVC